MDHNHQSSLGKSDQQSIWSLSGGDNQWSPVKSYTCAFCNKGFSSAQALGGHMNIHRKDRAKLREIFHENPLPLGAVDDHDHDHDPLQHKSIEETSNCIPKHVQLQDDIMFTCSSKDSGVFRDLEDEDSKLKTTETELDLELRLGPDQTREIPSTSSTMNTREFF